MVVREVEVPPAAPAPQNPRKLIKALAERVAGTREGPAPCARQVPVAHYVDAARFRREREGLFRRLPQVIAHGSQLASPGDAIAHDWMGLPLLTMRGEDGKVGTFMNVCRHRGMRLVAEAGFHQLRSLVCPYHAWTYDLEGRLSRVPRVESFSDFDMAAHGLVSLPTEERHGLVWVLPQPGAALDLDAHLAGLGDDFDLFGFPDARFFAQSIREVPCNWKLIQDAFLDGYHVVRLHRNSVGGFFPDALAETDTVGRHVRNAVARREIEETPGMGEAAYDLRRHVTFSYTLFPNSVLIMHPDYTSVISLFPRAVDETVFVHSMLVPAGEMDAARREHYARSFELIDRAVFEGEDLHVCIEAQRGFASGANDSLLFGGLECAAADFHGLIDEAIA